MKKRIEKGRIKAAAALLLISCVIALNAPTASAFQKAGEDGRASAPVNSLGGSDDQECKDSSSEKKDPKIAYRLYTNVKHEREPESAPTPERAFNAAVSAGVGGPRPPAPRTPAPRASTAPMSAGEKFQLFVDRSFRPPGPYAQSIFSGMFNELLDNNEGKEDTVGDYFADSMTRAARSMAFRITANFFEKFAYATILRQDPRYHRSNKSGAGAKIGYAISRVFITQGDRSGDQPNISYLAGGLTAAAIANVWDREERRTVGKTFRRWGTHIGITMLSNILREFIGGQ